MAASLLIHQQPAIVADGELGHFCLLEARKYYLELEDHLRKEPLRSRSSFECPTFGFLFSY